MAQGGCRAESMREACSRLLLPRPSQLFLLPDASHGHSRPQKRTSRPTWLWKTGGFGKRRCGPAGRTQAQSLCKQDIRLCQKDQKRLEVFLHSLSLPPSPLSLYLVLAVSRRLLPSKQEDMAAGETQLYAKVSNKLKGRNTSSLLDPLLAMGFPTHTA